MLPEGLGAAAIGSAKSPTNEMISISQCATLACLLEVIAPKPGNVHRGADFQDLTFTDFAVSALAIAPAMDAASKGQPVGSSVLQAIRDTRRVVNTNTNLGIVLLLTPMSAVPRHLRIEDGIEQVLGSLDESDSADVYEAIRLANPGCLGSVEQMDIAQRPPDNLLDAMRIASPRDMVARQYATNFDVVINLVAPWLSENQKAKVSLTDRLVHTHVRLMSQFPDSLIGRKCGSQIAQQSSNRASAVLKAGQPGDQAYHRGLADLDFWLRCDGHRRNPGTTADLVAAGLFVALREGIITPPFH